MVPQGNYGYFASIGYTILTSLPMNRNRFFGTAAAACMLLSATACSDDPAAEPQFVSGEGKLFLNEIAPSEGRIEIFNGGTTSADLTGYGIRNREGDLYAIPSGTGSVAPNGFAVIDCPLSAFGDDARFVLYLEDASGKRLDEADNATAHQTVRTGETFGRETNGTGRWIVFEQGTLGSSNVFGTVKPDFVPQFSIEATQITPTSAMVDVTATDERIVYFYTDLMKVSDWKSYPAGSDERIMREYRDAFDQLIAYYANYGEEWTYSYFLSKRSRLKQYTELFAATDYCIFAFGMDKDTGEFTSERITTGFFRTADAPRSDNTFAVEVDKALVTVTPTNDDPYFWTVAQRSVVDPLSDAELVRFMMEKYAASMSMYVATGRAEFDWSSSIAAGEYTAVVFGYEGGATTPVTRCDFTFKGDFDFSITGAGGSETVSLTSELYDAASLGEEFKGMVAVELAIAPSEGAEHWLWMPYEGDLDRYSDEEIIAHAFYPVIDMDYAAADKEEFTYYVPAGAKLTFVALAIDAEGRYGPLTRYPVEANLNGKSASQHRQPLGTSAVRPFSNI